MCELIILITLGGRLYFAIFHPEGKRGFQWLGSCKGHALLTMSAHLLVTQEKWIRYFYLSFCRAATYCEAYAERRSRQHWRCEGDPLIASSLCRQPPLLSDTLEATCEGLCSHRTDPNMSEGSSEEISENGLEILPGLSACSLSGSVCLNSYS